MLVKNVMNKNVMVAEPDMKITKAAELMSKHHIGSLVVINKKDEVKGILTERDILTDVVAKGKNLKHVLAKNIMTKHVVTIEPDKTIEEASDIMKKNKIKKLPVIENGKVMGIITASDIVTVQPRVMKKVRQLLRVDFRTKDGGIRLTQGFYLMLKSKINTIFGSFQILLGIISIIGVYMFYHQVEFLQTIVPSDIFRTFIFFILTVIGGLFLISGFFLLSLGT